MGFNNFRLQIFVRVIILAVFLSALPWSIYFTDWEVTPFACLFLALLSVIELIYFVEKSNRKLKNFLTFIHHRDFSTHFTDNREGEIFSELVDAYQLINQEFKTLNAEKEANSQYLELIIEHIDSALLCIDASGNITLMNRQANRLFKSPYLHNISSLKKICPELLLLINKMGHGSQRLANITIANENLQLSIHSTRFQLIGESYTLYSFQNIRNELEQQEIKSWQKLIRVLTHEIMNSVTPIISLSGVLKEKLQSDPDGAHTLKKLSSEELEDLQKSIDSIESRSKGLQHFVQTYRRFTEFPEPSISTLKVQTLLDNVCTLLHPELEKREIKVKVVGKNNELTINVDAQQMEQVLINLISNAMHAVSDNPEPLISIHIDSTEKDKVRLQVKDNGQGIDSEYIDQIFVPFFTTKQDGTGIGLSLSRQLCAQNNVLLSLVSSTENGTIFMLQFQIR